MSSLLTCSKCQEDKGVHCFYKRKNRKRGFDYQCKECKLEKKSNLSYKPKVNGVKTCSRCMKEKQYVDFGTSKQYKDGRNSWCRFCEYMRKRKKLECPKYRMVENLRRRTRAVLQGTNKSRSTLRLIGCSSEQLKEHLESKFTDGMNWNNYGKWHIDHIKPCASFDLTDSDQQKICFNFQNLQPLWAVDNLRKSNKEIEL